MSNKTESVIMKLNELSLPNMAATGYRLYQILSHWNIKRKSANGTE